MQKILVTGASGFLGGHVVRELVAKGCAVRALSRSSGDFSGMENVESVMASVLDGRALRKAMKDCRAVIHLAGRVSRDPSDASDLEALHVTGTRRVLECAHRESVKRIIYLSTSGTVAVTKSPETVPDESFPYPEPLASGWPYYASKIRAEKLAMQLAKKFGLDLVILNPSLLLGPGDSRISSVGDVLDFLKGRVPAIPSGGLSFVDVRDVAKATVAALKRGRSGERYLLGAANWNFHKFFTRLGEITARRAPSFEAPDLPTLWAAKISAPIFRKLGYEPPLDPVSIEMSQAYWYLDSSKSKKELGFRPRHPNETLWDTAEDLRKKGLCA